jgi:hypothetical protein
MEPLHPDFRRALKDAHPDLTDEIIDRIEELRGRRFELDPSTHADEIARLDRERIQLIKHHMPHYKSVAQAFASRASETHRPPPPVVSLKRGDRKPPR